MSLPPTPTEPDLTRVCERLAQRLERSGATNPVAAAVAQAARGHTGLDIDAFAHHCDLACDVVRRAEAGEVPFEDLPMTIGQILESMPGIDLLGLADLDTELRRPGPPGH